MHARATKIADCGTTIYFSLLNFNFHRAVSAGKLPDHLPLAAGGHISVPQSCFSMAHLCHFTEGMGYPGPTLSTYPILNLIILINSGGR